MAEGGLRRSGGWPRRCLDVLATPDEGVDVTDHTVGPRSVAQPVRRVRGGRPAGWSWAWRARRAADIAVGLAALLLLAPVMLVIAAVVRAATSGPIFSVETRVGCRGVPFGLLTFQPVCGDTGQHRQEPAARGPRLGRVGRLLRRYDLDQVPQLWNLIRGDISLLGPRAALPDEGVR